LTSTLKTQNEKTTAQNEIVLEELKGQMLKNNLSLLANESSVLPKSQSRDHDSTSAGLGINCLNCHKYRLTVASQEEFGFKFFD